MPLLSHKKMLALAAIAAVGLLLIIPTYERTYKIHLYGVDVQSVRVHEVDMHDMGISNMEGALCGEHDGNKSWRRLHKT
jgi:hypothetical protein